MFGGGVRSSPAAKRRAIRRRWQTDAQRLAARPRARGVAKLLHWTKVAAEVPRIAPSAGMDINVVQAIVDDELHHHGESELAEPDRTCMPQSTQRDLAHLAGLRGSRIESGRSMRQRCQPCQGRRRTPLSCLAYLVRLRPFTINPQGVGYASMPPLGFACAVIAAAPDTTGAIERGSAPPMDGALKCRMIFPSHRTTPSILPAH